MKKKLVDYKTQRLISNLIMEFECLENDEVKEMQVRYRTVGDMTCTGAVISNASNIAEIIQEVASARVTERGGRADDKRSEAAMEDRKREGYF